MRSTLLALSLSLLAVSVVPAQETQPGPGPAPSNPGKPSEPGLGSPGLGTPGDRKGPPPPAVALTTRDVKADEPPRVVRVNVTNQSWDFTRPWGKRPPYSRRAVGAVLTGKRVLVSAELVGNANYVEFELPDGGGRTPATIEAVDYECNLAVLRGEDEKFLDGFKPFELTDAKVGDTINIWQLENTGVVLATAGPLTTVEVSRYPADDSMLLVYRSTASIQFRDSSFVLPAVKAGKLAGLVVRYDNSANSAEIVPSPVIQHFLNDAAKAPYDGFPRTGMGFANTRDPQLRRYAGIKPGGGIYVTQVLKDGPAAIAGLKSGDIILSIDGHAIDQDGNYADPDYGKIALIHLLSTRHYVGDVVKFSIEREGVKQEVPVTLSHRDVHSYTIEPYVIDRAPKFYILGGLILQELSRQYLKEFGNDWVKRAPPELVYYDRYQNELFADGPKKVVILSRVLPMPSTLGYEELHHLRVTKINGVELQSLADVPAALAKPQDGVHKIEFDTDPHMIFLDAAGLTADQEALVKNYRLPTTQRLED
jgi:S1-C subfamily serine protease